MKKLIERTIDFTRNLAIAGVLACLVVLVLSAFVQPSAAMRDIDHSEAYQKVYQHGGSCDGQWAYTCSAGGNECTDTDDIPFCDGYPE